MRLKWEQLKEFEYFPNKVDPCQRERGTVCLHPQYGAYYQRCEKIADERRKWYKADMSGIEPKYPPPDFNCEDCEYADKELGMFNGDASGMTASDLGIKGIPVPLKGRKRVRLYNVNQKMLSIALKEINPDIEFFMLGGSPGIGDFSFLERFKKLKTVRLNWSNKADKLWNFSKTPDIEELSLCSFNRLSDVSQLRDARKLRHLTIDSDAGIVSGIQSLRCLERLEYLRLYTKVADKNILPIIALPSLKYFDCLVDIFDVESYAMFEARRPEIDINFVDGIQGEFDALKPEQGYWLAGKGQGYIKYGQDEKYKKFSDKYNAAKQRYLTEDYIPVIQLSQSGSPVEGWRQILADGIELHTAEQIDEIERIFTDYVNRTAASASKGQAKNVLKDAIKKITEVNGRTQFIETEESQEIYDYLSSFFKEKWYDEFEELLADVDW